MKRMILFLLTVLLLFILASCNNTNKSEVIKISENKADMNTNAGVSDITEVEELDNGNDVLKQSSIDLSAFIPEGWHLLDTIEASKATGDLNKDGTQDIAFVVEGKATEKEAASRMLIIVSGSEDSSYSLLAQAYEAILRADEGGVMGDPFMGIGIDRGSLLINHYGGSSWRWSSSYRFRYQDGGFYLIGATEDWFNAASDAGRVYEDFNLLTGNYIRKEYDDNGVEKEVKSNRGKKKLINIVDFDINGERQF